MRTLATQRQQGMTLLVSMIMLIVLTLLVVSAIRFGNVNLRIANNTQVKSEAAAAANVALEQVLDTAKAAANLDAVNVGGKSYTVKTGGATYTVNTSKPTCNLSRPVLNSELSPSDPNDLKCFESQDADKAITPSNTTTTAPSACNSQLWSVQADVDDGSTGAKVTSVQGFQVRVSAQTKCN